FERVPGAGAARTQDLAPEETGVRARGKEIFRKVAYLPDEFIGWYPAAVRRGVRVVRERNIDVVLSSSPPNSAHLVGRAIARRTGRPHVVDFRDAWTRNPSYRHAEGWRGRVERRLERAVVRSAERLVTVSEGIRNDFLRDHGALDPETIAVIANGFDPEDFEGPRLPEELAPASGRMRIAFTGSWLDDRSPETFMKALSIYAATARGRGPKIEALFAGTEQAGIRRAAERAGVSALVRTVGYLPARTCCALQRSADALLLVLKDGPQSAGVLSGKIFQYLGAGRPVLALVPEGAAADLVRKTGAGCVVAPGDAEGAARALCALARAKESGRPLRGADSQILAPYTRRSVAGRFASLLSEVADG
ncbi:MAG: glycosyltransferase, partial [Myxococcota bacterium]